MISSNSPVYDLERIERPNLTTRELSLHFFEDFGRELLTDNLRTAHQKYIDGEHETLCNTLNLSAAADFRKSCENPKDFDQVMGILTDVQKLDTGWRNYTLQRKVELADRGEVSLYEIFKNHSDDSETPLDSDAVAELWKQPIKMLEVPDLMSVAEDVNLETVFVESVHTLAELEAAPYGSRKAYELANKSEAMLAPLCEIIGFDGLAMALRSRVACIELRNTGQGQYVDAAEQILSEFAGDCTDGENLCYDNLRREIQSIVAQVIGPNNHDLVVGTGSRHGVVFGDGECTNGDSSLRKIWRMKSVGSLAKKLARWAADNRKARLTAIAVRPLGNLAEEEKSDIMDDRSVETPMDIAGVTLVAKTRTELADTYATAFRNLLPKLENPSLDDEIYPYQAPSREHAFFVEGDDEFIDVVKTRLTDEFGENIEKFVKFKVDTKKGFRVAKLTGYHSGESAILPFEIQIITQDDRHNSRVGKAAHIFYKLSRQLGKRYDPTEEDLQRLAHVNERKEHFGSDGLCGSSQLVVKRLNEMLDGREAASKNMSRLAINS